MFIGFQDGHGRYSLLVILYTRAFEHVASVAYHHARVYPSPRIILVTIFSKQERRIKNAA